MLNVFSVDFVIFDQSTAKRRTEGNVCTGTYCTHRYIRHRRRTRKAWISDNQRRIVIVFASIAQRETHRMRFCGIIRPSPSSRRWRFNIAKWDLVIAPRPNVGARLAYRWSVSDARAQLSTASIPRERANFCVQHPRFIAGRRRRTAFGREPAVNRDAPARSFQ